ncbi:MAG: hypothetical protein NFCOHLIN_02622 [Gammaproteobacteria bacterium]|nr:hypothetical protein [Gammaproteobacteria bacterium]
MSAQPKISRDPMYQLLRDENIQEFNERRSKGANPDMRGVDLRGLDLRNMNVDGLDFTDAYFRGADLRGLDFRNSRLEGVSLAAANISGCYFPKDLAAAEILLSVTHGIRMRYGSR